MNMHKSEEGTDVLAFISDLDGGELERKMSLALSRVAAATVDNDRVGEVDVRFIFKRIAGTNQVHVQHLLKFTKPTMNGKASEEETRSTPMHVGKFGRLTLAPESQIDMFKSGEPAKL